MFMPRPHDLLRLSGTWVPPSDAPPWANSALHVTPWVVVRRAAPPVGRIAVGVRGKSRSERYATAVDPDDVREVVEVKGGHVFAAILQSQRTKGPVERVAIVSLVVYVALERCKARAFGQVMPRSDTMS